MATYTTNYNLKKPADSDSYDIADANGNMDIIDGALNTLNNHMATFDVGTREQLLSAISTLNTQEIRKISIYGDMATEAVGWAGRTFGLISKTAATRYELTLFSSINQIILVSDINSSTGELENVRKFIPQNFQTKDYTYAYTIPANSSLAISAANLNISTPSGYKAISVVNINPANDHVVVRGFRCDNDTGNVVWLRNLTGSSISSTLYMSILYMYVRS